MEVVGAWKVLSGMAVDADTTEADVRLVDRCVEMQGMDHVQAEEIYLGIMFGTEIVGRRACTCAVLVYVEIVEVLVKNDGRGDAIFFRFIRRSPTLQIDHICTDLIGNLLTGTFPRPRQDYVNL